MTNNQRRETFIKPLRRRRTDLKIDWMCLGVVIGAPLLSLAVWVAIINFVEWIL